MGLPFVPCGVALWNFVAGRHGVRTLSFEKMNPFPETSRNRLFFARFSRWGCPYTRGIVEKAGGSP